MKKRLCLMLLFFAAALTALSIRIGFLQLYDDGPLAVMAEGQYLTELGEVTQRAAFTTGRAEKLPAGRLMRIITSARMSETKPKMRTECRTGTVRCLYQNEKDGVSEEAAEREAGGEKESDSDLGQSLKTAGGAEE